MSALVRGQRCYVHQTASIGGTGTVVLGDDCYVGPSVTISGPATIGDRAHILPGCRIGMAGFGYTLEGDELVWKPHHHGVVIGDDVHISANTCVDRGSWRDTVIGRGTKIDNLVHVAHNVHTGENCLIVAQSLIAGSCELADYVYVGAGATVRERLRLGRRCIVGMGAVVVKDVPAESIVAGVPARVFGRVEVWPPPPPEGREHA